MKKDYFTNDVDFITKLTQFFDEDNRNTGRSTLMANILAQLIATSDRKGDNGQRVWVQDHMPFVSPQAYKIMCDKIENRLKKYAYYNGLNLEISRFDTNGFYVLESKSFSVDNPKLVINGSIVYQPKKENKIKTEQKKSMNFHRKL